VSGVPPVGLTRLHSVAIRVHDVDIWSSAVQKRAWLPPPGAKRPDGPRSPPGGGRPMSRPTLDAPEITPQCYPQTRRGTRVSPGPPDAVDPCRRRR
jgi:hypothetical protein